MRVGAGLVAVAATVAVALLARGSDYQVSLVLPSAAQLVEQGPVLIKGREVGSIEQIQAKDGKAIVTLSINDDAAPLHEGTSSRVAWNSLLGERTVNLKPGPATNAAYPNGALIEAASSQIEVDQVLAALDGPTRKRLNSLIVELNGTVGGREQELRETIQAAGPTVKALGQILKAVGQDGPAIRELVRQLHAVTEQFAQRQTSVRGTVDGLAAFADDIAEQQAQVSKALGELPSTLDVAAKTLNMVPHATDATVPLLQDLQAATARLPSVARNLKPLLEDLRPTIAQLRPTLRATYELLGKTPGLLDTTHQVLPGITRAMEGYQPALAFLRPYSPELMGWLTTWSNAFSGYDSQGHVWAGIPAPGPATNNESVLQLPPSGVLATPAPGHNVGQPWTDAFGSEMQ